MEGQSSRIKDGPKMSRDRLPNKIRELRKAHGLKLNQVAPRVGCSITMLSDLERGNRPLSYPWMKSIARELRVKPADLFNEEDGGPQLSGDERKLVESYREGSPEQQHQIRELLEIILRRHRVREL